MLTKNEWLSLIRGAVLGAVEGDGDKAMDSLNRIAENSTVAGMYSTCCAFADMGKGALEQVSGVTIDENAVAGFETHGHDAPAELFAHRFLTAYANADEDTTTALFVAALEAGAEAFTDSVVALVLLTAGWIERAVAQRAEGCSG